MKKTNIPNLVSALVRLMLFALVFAMMSCSREESIEPTAAEEEEEEVPFLLTQELLDAATFVRAASDTLISGDPFAGRNNDPARLLIRDVFTNVQPGQRLAEGSIIAVRAFEDNNGRRGNLVQVDVMVKRAAGFNPSGADFEYIRTPFDPNVNYRQHPNGLVPELLSSARGLDLQVEPLSCVNCHRFAGGEDFVWHRNF